MAEFTANRILSGSYAEIWVDSRKIAEVSGIKLNVSMVRKDVQMGIDVDSKIVGIKGEGEMRIKQVYTRFYDVLSEAKSGRDRRVDIMTALSDPDSVGGAEERYTLSDVAFSELPLVNYETGKINEQVIKFKFAPSRLKCIAQIPVARTAGEK